MMSTSPDHTLRLDATFAPPEPSCRETVFQRLFREPVDQPVTQDADVVKARYAHWRLRIFYSTFIGYATFYLCKKNISAALPDMSAKLGYSNTELGLLGSTLYFTYAFGKFINGMIADRANVRTFLPVALAAVGVSNLLLVMSSWWITPGRLSFFGLPAPTVLLWVMSFFWGCNGWFQSMGFPSIAKSLTYWYSNQERGLKWSLWSTSHQLGTILSFQFSQYLIGLWGWQAAFFVPGLASIAMAVILFNRLRDKPSTLGLPEVESYREPDRQQTAPAALKHEPKASYWQIIRSHILLNKTIWLLSLANIFVYLIRFGTEDWGIKYLVEVKHNSIEMASNTVSFLPLFGIAGTILGGYLSDKVFQGKRMPMNIIFMAGVILALFALQHNGSSNVLDMLYFGCVGMCIYGPQALIGGVCIVEASSKEVASASTGFVGSFGYGGAILSGVGTGILVDHFRWNGALYFWMAGAVLCLLLCVPLLFMERATKKQHTL